MACYKVTPAAKADLKSIARYTQHKWGRKKRNQYLSALDNRFSWLADDPQLGKCRDEVKTGYRSYPEGLHVIFYRIVKGSIEILGVLHQNMDFKKHL